MSGDELEVEDFVSATCEWEADVSDEMNMDATDMDVSADLSADME